MSEGKRYYWLKLKDDFFDSKRIKKLRRMAGGDTYTIIYLKMQLLAMKHEGVIQYTGLEASFAEELALDIDEEAEDVGMTLAYLLSVGLAETSDNVEFFFPYAIENVGSEGAAAQRKRDQRARERALEVSTRDFVTLPSHFGHGESEIESEKEKEKELERESESDKKPVVNFKPSRGRPGSKDEVIKFFQEEKLNGEPEAFFDHYTGINWMTGGSPITDWKAIARCWSRKEKNYGGRTSPYKVVAGTGKPDPVDIEDLKRRTAWF